MISVKKWLRRRWWAIEDALTDLIDWQPRPASPKPLPPEEPKHYGSCLCASVSFQRMSNEQAHTEMWNAVFKALGRGQFFEIRQ
jgi:hypothetical protein